MFPWKKKYKNNLGNSVFIFQGQGRFPLLRAIWTSLLVLNEFPFVLKYT